jgi:hypothetical protein
MPTPKPPYLAEFRKQLVELFMPGRPRPGLRVSSTSRHRASRAG